MIREAIQLEMNFDGTDENRFKQRFDLGEFQLIAELPVPSADTPLADAVADYVRGYLLPDKYLGDESSD